MKTNWSYKALEEFGRIRLSENFYMREFLHSEIAQIYGLINAPKDRERAIAVGEALCETILEPIQAAWGRIHIRSAYRSEEVNNLGNENKLNCSSNANNLAAHIWDVPDNEGLSGATACIVLPKYQTYYEETGDWVSLAWWLHRNIESYSDICFFKNQCAFNIRWYEDLDRPKSIRTFVPNLDTGDKKPLVKANIISSAYNDTKIEACVRNAISILNR